jgi:ribosomal protein L12E/L44/L45/RPP1/RPP2
LAADLASLVIGLRADVASLQSDLGKALSLNQKHANDIAGLWNKAGESVADSLKDIAGKLAGAFAVEQLVEAGKKSLEFADNLGKMSQKVGISVESLSALNVQARLSDVGIDSLQGGLAKLARNAADAAAGSKQQAAAFQAMGVSLKDANGNLRSTEDILGSVAGKFSQYADSASKTALAQQVFGKSGADLIPLLNELGENGFAKAREEAERFGAVISTETAKQAETFNDNLTRLKLEGEGFANAIVSQLLPGLDKLTDDLVKAGETTGKYGDTASVVANVIKGVALSFLALAESVKAVTNIVGASGDTLATVFSLPVKAGAALASGGFDAMKKSVVDSLAGVKAAWTSAGTGIGDVVGNVKKDFNDLFGTFSNVSGGAETTAGAVKKMAAPLVVSADASDRAAKALEDYNKAQLAAGAFLAKLSGEIDPINKAYADYVANIIQANKISQEMVDKGTKAGKAIEAQAEAQQFLSQVTAKANGVLDDQLAKLVKQGDVVGNYLQKIGQDQALVGLSERESGITQAINEQVDAWNKLDPAIRANEVAMGNLDPTTEAGRNAIASATGALYDSKKAFDASQKAAQDWADIWKSAGNEAADAIGKAVVEGGSLLKSLTDIAKQVVEQIISYFVKLSVINPILNSIFGGTFGGGAGGGLLPTLAGAASAFGGGASSGGSGDFNMGGYSGVTASGNAALFGTAQQGFSLLNAGKTIWDGFSNGLSKFWNGAGYNMGGPAGLGGTGYTSGFGQALGVAGGIYAGYNRYQQGGALGGVAGGVTYGLGTYALGAGIAGAAAGTGFAAGVGGAFAIPVIGWAALIAMVIDKISGGKLFGTDANKFKFGQQTLSIDGTGASLSAGADYVGQKALFGGSYHEWKTLDVGQDAIDAANDFFDQLKKGTENFAKQFGTTMGDVVGGTFTQTFDKHGNVTATSSVVNGVTYKDTADQFQERIIAENELAVLGKFDAGLSAAVDKYRANADDLANIVNSLATVQLDFNNGLHLMALGSDQTTSALLKLAEGTAGFGESVEDALTRIVQAQQQYDQFVAQFKPATNYVDDFEGALSQINASMLANIKQANALAVAAGAAGASEKDLANIHAYAAQQAAEAIKALQASAQSLAFGLGLTTQGSLDDVNQEIARLQAKAGDAAQPVRDFGAAISQAADRAKHAMDLLLGDLSPLNDQQKLQTALQGLRAGTVTQDQVLEIGRRLYASTAQYTALFNMVRNMGGGNIDVSGAVGGNTRPSGAGLSADEQSRLKDLLEEQQTLQAAAQLQQYQTLAQQVAEIASAKGEDWQQVLSDMGVNIDKFEKGLNLTDQQTSDYIDAIQKQVDDNGDNTESLIAALDRLTRALGGTVPSGGDTSSRGTPFGDNSDVGTFGGTQGRGGTDSRNHGHAGQRNITDDDAKAIGTAVAIGIQTVSPRGSRPPDRRSSAR